MLSDQQASTAAYPLWWWMGPAHKHNATQTTNLYCAPAIKAGIWSVSLNSTSNRVCCADQIITGQNSTRWHQQLPAKTTPMCQSSRVNLDNDTSLTKVEHSLLTASQLIWNSCSPATMSQAAVTEAQAPVPATSPDANPVPLSGSTYVSHIIRDLVNCNAILQCNTPTMLSAAYIWWTDESL